MQSATFICVLTLLLISAPALSDESTPPLPKEHSIGVLLAEHVNSLPYMCECEFFHGPINAHAMVFATRNAREVGFAVVDGNLTTFRRDGEQANPNCRTNARFHERWVSGATVLVLDEHVTGSGAEACWYRGEMSVTVGTHTVSTPVSGACGC